MSESALRILVIEDEPDLALTLCYNLQNAGYEVATEPTGREGLIKAESFHPNLVLLDLMLPDTSGFEVCRALKTNEMTCSAPVVMLTARGEEVDRVRGFEVGAEDYVLKPFSVKELLLRIKVILRRTSSSMSEDSSEIKFGSLRINQESHQVWVEHEEIALTILEFRLICKFVLQKGKTQSRSALLSEVWGTSGELTTRTVDTHVKRLRDKLKGAGKYIQTIRGVGYRCQQTPDA